MIEEGLQAGRKVFSLEALENSVLDSDIRYRMTDFLSEPETVTSIRQCSGNIRKSTVRAEPFKESSYELVSRANSVGQLLAN